MNVADYLLEQVIDQNTAIIAKENNFSYGDLRNAASRLAGELSSLDLGPGARVGILGQNSLFWAAAYLATIKLGFVAVPFATTLNQEDISRNANWADCKAVFLEGRQQQKFKNTFDNKIAIILDEILNQSGGSYWPSSSEEFNIHQDAALMFTSGTTARPRAVRVTHRNIQANTDSIIKYLQLSKSERILVILPFYYCYGTSLLHTHLRVGGSLALSNTFTFPETSLNMMEEAECTGFAGVPSTFQLLLRNSTFVKRKTPTLQKIQQAGGKLHNILIQEMITGKPNAKVYVMYGQTEATARLSYLPPAMLDTKMGSIGKGIPDVELRVLDDAGHPIKPGDVGEIIARGDNISPGYFNDPESSAKKFIGGALQTGDLATIDDEGFIYVVDRKADFIKSWGYRISSQEVEACVLKMPEVISAAVVGVPDLVAGEAIHAFVTLHPKTDIATEDIVAHCREHLAKHMVPKMITVLRNLPLNAHGKVIKSKLRELAIQNNNSEKQ